jgi:glucose-6-phosphate isomerase
MQLPDENIDYDFRRLLAPLPDAWTPLAELQTKHFLAPDKLDPMRTKMNAIRGQIASERELQNPPAKLQPLQVGYIDLPQKLLDQFRRKGDQSELGKLNRIATRIRENCDRFIVLGVGGSHLAGRALFEALGHNHHNEMPPKMRMGRPRLYFEGHDLDNDSVQELIELFDHNCVDPDLPEERWGFAVIGKSGDTLETAAAFRAFRAEAARFYGPRSEWLRKLIVPVTGIKGKLRELAKADGIADEDILTIPDDIGGRYSALTPVGLLPAAVVGLDVRALLLGAAAMTKRFLEEPFERNPVLQYAAVNYLMVEEHGKTTRVMNVWNRKLESVGRWYDQMICESLGKAGRGPLPLTAVCSRDLYTRGQLHQDGPRDKVFNNLIVRQCKQPPVMVGMADRNEDDLNCISRKGYPDLLEAAFRSANEAHYDTARPSADIVLPNISEHTMGQLLQMLMLATAVEARLGGTNPYGQPSVEAYKTNTMRILKATPNLPKGEMRDAAKGL